VYSPDLDENDEEPLVKRNRQLGPLDMQCGRSTDSTISMRLDRRVATAPCILPAGTKRKSAVAAPSMDYRQYAYQLHSASEFKRRRLSKRARTRLTDREINTHIQPGISSSDIESMPDRFEKRKTITLSKAVEFFKKVEMKLIAVNVGISVILTAFVCFLCPESWREGLEESSVAVSVLGAFLSFALVFRTHSAYARWWEARTQWGRMASACVNLSGMACMWV